MAHPLNEEAVDAPRSLSMDDAAAAFEDLDNIEAEDQDDPEAELFADPETNEPEEAEEAEDEADEGEDEEGDEEEPAEPAIPPPASLTAEEKADWAQLPPEAQQKIVAIEARRTVEVQQGLEKARNAQREAETTAASRIAEAERLHAEQLAKIATAYAPQPPDIRLIGQNPAAYLEAKARYDDAQAQHDKFMQQVQTVHEEATKEQERLEQEALQAQWQAVRNDLPEAADPAQWKELMTTLAPLALDMGYPEELLAEATPTDIRALKRIHTRLTKAEEKAAKYDAIMARQMTKVRAGKTAKPNAAQPAGSGKVRAHAKAYDRFKSNPSSMAAAAAVFEDI